MIRVLVGPPGAGKTTWCQRNLTQVDAVVSLDDARARIGPGWPYQTVNALAVIWTVRQAVWFLNLGHPVTVDATGASIRDRATWLELTARHRTAAHAVVLRVALRTCLARNAQRDRVVPAEVVTRMHRQVERTSARELLLEGFSVEREITMP